MTSIYYFICGLCLYDVIRPSKKRKCWLQMKKYQIDKFLFPKGSIKFSPHSQLLQTPKVIAIVMSWCSLNIICPVNYATTALLSIWHHQNYGQLQCPFLGVFGKQSGPFIIHRQDHPPKISSQHAASVFLINCQF